MTTKPTTTVTHGTVSTRHKETTVVTSAKSQPTVVERRMPDGSRYVIVNREHFDAAVKSAGEVLASSRK
ncbi:hypothetical protein [Oleomonas cavernae]|uniref:hypothetical protein n=1 Tax=Oleomonas cavernae TaxID=2320859 RepID=UPI0011C389BF|nr:hypothetical protein [Oleomonas cavernae]